MSPSKHDSAYDPANDFDTNHPTFYISQFSPTTEELRAEAGRTSSRIRTSFWTAQHALFSSRAPDQPAVLPPNHTSTRDEGRCLRGNDAGDGRWRHLTRGDHMRPTVSPDTFSPSFSASNHIPVSFPSSSFLLSCDAAGPTGRRENPAHRAMLSLLRLRMNPSNTQIVSQSFRAMRTSFALLCARVALGARAPLHVSYRYFLVRSVAQQRSASPELWTSVRSLSLDVTARCRYVGPAAFDIHSRYIHLSLPQRHLSLTFPSDFKAYMRFFSAHPRTASVFLRGLTRPHPPATAFKATQRLPSAHARRSVRKKIVESPYWYLF
ncbi:hypothetical protein DFH09DRAFT_1338101 [Mycena vulgaris]|nr:hypothetical protein DFH09DRAFT_1338101 [Mycena vulgaris]